MTGRDTSHLVLVGGLAGAGKSTVSREVCRQTGFTYLDKDKVVGHMTSQVMKAYGFRQDDRDSELYVNEIRAIEYRCLMDSVVANIAVGNSTVADAPFTREFADPKWRADLQRDCDAALGAPVQIHYVWLHADDDVMKRNLIERGYPRDEHKLHTWAIWLPKARSVQPLPPCVVVDTSARGEASLRAAEIVGEFSLLGSIDTIGVRRRPALGLAV